LEEGDRESNDDDNMEGEEQEDPFEGEWDARIISGTTH